MAAAKAPPSPSRLQGDFVIYRLLGAGAFGAVLECRNRLEGKAYAVKIAELDGGNAVREVQNWVRVPVHENLVQYYTCWEDSFNAEELDGVRQTLRVDASHEMFRAASGRDSLRVLCIQMELCEHDLRKWLAEHPVVNEEQSMSIFIQVARGLQHLHAHGVLHRDLKPENVFLANVTTSSSPKVKIGDLGIATAHLGSTRAARHTHGVGTPLYLAPEQGTSQYGKPADIFTLGLIFFELLHPSIQPTANRGSYDALIQGFNDLKYQRRVPVQIKTRWPKAGELILKMTEVDPSQRPNFGQVYATFTSSKTASGANAPVSQTSSSSHIVHASIMCDGCGVEDFRGIRYKCSKCYNFDLCEQCEKKGAHRSDHALLKIRTPVAEAEEEPVSRLAKAVRGLKLRAPPPPAAGDRDRLQQFLNSQTR